MKTLREMTFEEAAPIYQAFHERTGIEVFSHDGWVDWPWTSEGLELRYAYRVKTFTMAELLGRLEALPDPIGKMAAGEIKRLELAVQNGAADFLKSLNSPSRAASDEWIEWGGGECPVDPTLRVQAVLCDGSLSSNTAGNFEWNHSDDDGDIVRYRVVKP